MKRYSTIMSVLLTLALPVAGNCADTVKAPEKSDATVEAGKTAAGKVEGGKDSQPKTGQAKAAAEKAPAASTANLNPSGKVAETMDGGGYSYARLEKNGKSTWVAYASQPTHVGDTLSFRDCMEMPNFQSTALKRTFESILFCGKSLNATASADKLADKKSPGSQRAKASGKVAVEKATGANAYTVAEIYAKRSQLSGKQVVVKGQVIKVASGIMNTNWIHLQDGSGTEKQKNNDLMVTSSTLPAPGDVVTVSGILTKDKDFGSGYKYSVIIEKGNIK